MKEELIGHFGVDAGLVMICDPCYIYGREGLSEQFPKSWREFLDKFLPQLNESPFSMPQHAQMNYALGNKGLGVLSETGYGDGYYPVYATFNDEGRIIRLRIEFDEEF